MVTIRPEKPEDYQLVYDINQKAFNREAEARLVEKLRKTSRFIPNLSLVAIKDKKLVGHVLFSIIFIKTDSKSIPVLALAPIAVLPEYQKQGIGSLLIREGIKKCKNLGYKAIILVGYPNYYPRFGFTPAKEKGLNLSFDAPEEAFMVYEIIPKTLKGVKGTIEFPPEFDEANEN